ncbi:MAG: hypothetical protein HY902_06305 [Deltaproteobacteria bacterium]|nr:hypothetical protein [Deltaproteobacteria bacterium]
MSEIPHTLQWLLGVALVAACASPNGPGSAASGAAPADALAASDTANAATSDVAAGSLAVDALATETEPVVTADSMAAGDASSATCAQVCAHTASLGCDDLEDFCGAACAKTEAKLVTCKSAFAQMLGCVAQLSGCSKKECYAAMQVYKACTAAVANKDCASVTCFDSLETSTGAHGCTCAVPCFGHTWGFDCQDGACTCNTDGEPGPAFSMPEACTSDAVAVLQQHCGLQ